MHKTRLLHWALLLPGMLAVSQSALAWGATGHRLVSAVGVAVLPQSMPAFLRSPETTAMIAALGREPDRSKGAGTSHDRDLNPGHYLNLGDEGLVGGAVDLKRLPPDREAYDTVLREKGLDEYRAGYLPYSILDGWQQIRKDFAYWRADVAGAKRRAAVGAERAWYERDRKLREMLTLRDIGYWSHFVADGSQPLHVSIHFNGWGDYPNPDGYSDSKTVHANFEGRYVADNVKRGDVLAAVPAARDPGCDIETEVGTYLLATNRNVVPLYRLEKQGAFTAGNSAGKPFVVSRLAAAAAELRDLIVAAWRCSESEAVGYPPIPVRDVESGRDDPYSALRGMD